MDAERAQYLKTIERRFLELRGRGLMLSPRDVMLVDRWRERGVPLRVVLGALEEGVQRFVDGHSRGTPLPGSLAYFTGHVENAVSNRRELLIESAASRGARSAESAKGSGDQTEAAGNTAPSLLRPGARQALLDIIAAAGRQQGTESAREALRYAWRRLVKPSSDEALWSLGGEVDRELVDMLAATLEPQEAARLRSATDAAVAAAGGTGMSQQAQGDIARGELERWVRERFAVPDLMEVLFEYSV